MKLSPATVAALAAILHAAAARPSPAGYVRHEARDAGFEASWRKGASVEEDVLVPVRVGLVQSNLDKGAEMLMDISHPASPNFGKKLSQQEVADLFAPSQDRIDAVRGWLESSMGDRVVSVSPNRQWLKLNATIGELQDLLHTEYHEYEHAVTGKTVLGCDQYHVPGHVREHLDFITPGVTTLEIRKRDGLAKRDNGGGGGAIHPKITKIPSFSPQVSSGASDCGFAITPDCVRALYNVTDTLEGNADNSIGIYETESEFWNQTDLNLFFTQFAPNIPQGTHPEYDAIDGAPPVESQTFPGGEADLDFQAAYPLVYPDKVVNYQVDDEYYETTGAGTFSGIFNTFLDGIDASYCTYTAFNETGDAPGVDPTYPDTHPNGYDQPEQCGAYAPTNVISISYSIDEDRLPMNYQLRQCNEWMKLGLQGVSVVVSSGDSGVAPRSGVCARNNTLFATQSPIDCPYVTAVGATYLPAGGVAGQTPESATNEFGSGGGFSNVFGQPSYQADAVNAYFTNSPPPYSYYNVTLNATHTEGIYNRGGRGYPDVSATGQGFAIYYDGIASLAAGTSVSAPVFAALISRINSARLSAGKSSLGFLNPTLYAHPEVFNDITSGNNPGCGTDGFTAVKGWDPVTGLGTPNYGKMKDLFMGLD